MNPEVLLALLKQVQCGLKAPEEAVRQLSHLPYEDAGFAKIDHHRSLRIGFPEVIYAEGKTPQQVAEIFFRMARAGGDVLATRVAAAAAEAVLSLVPEAIHHKAARAITLKQSVTTQEKGRLAVLCAGTSDLPIAEEAAVYRSTVCMTWV